MRLRVFVFDDDEQIRGILWRILDRRGYEVFTFPDPGLCPLHVASGCMCPDGQTCGDVVISDLNMPDITGLEYVASQREKGCKVKKVALMSGSWSESDLQFAEDLGCKIFRKPFSVEEIDDWLDECEEETSPDRILFDWFREKTDP